ncbi:hypothetical protein HH845_005402 [Escherichia coli]|uniref:Uncharacterized protein n=2 Tax=Escherichia coli TaxID=562 RepID=A0A1Y2XZI2_ECOLX|nr:hypothetical protein I3M_18665 [Escherichia coli O26 str. RM8426]AWJ55638.1 hypothetical protein I3U_19995 [Escherichia coli O26 str. RM10386]EFC1902308.1 hypothetical protein [Escherichia coli]EHW77575.1 hypothetical protein ECDEC10D_3313 [Escherichia coli DEC10D]KDV69816.1 hypothetical protein BU58_22625 [Escherichia coli O26:H11 str. 2011C-3274]QCH98451.1 hypothetical protein B9S25_008135 [Escherichia coli O26:H11]
MTNWAESVVSAASFYLNTTTSELTHRWVKFTQLYSISQYHAVNMLPSVAIMLLTCDRVQNVVCD